MKPGTGSLGYGIAGSVAAEAELFNNWVAQGALVEAPTTASAQLTGTGNGTYRYNLTHGIVHVDTTIKEIAAAADQLLEAAGNIMASGYSKVYSIIQWKNPSTGVISTKSVPGTAALTGAQVAPTLAEIEATIPDGAWWVHLADVTVNRTADTAVTQSADNTVRPSLIPVTANRS